MQKFYLHNKTAIVTGGGRGIGKAISKTFASRGACVHILDFNRKDGKTTVEEISSTGHRAQFHLCDVSQSENVSKVVDTIHAEYNIDILINNAGIAHVGNIEAVGEEELDHLYKVNIKGVYNCIKACIGIFKKNKSGVILNMASIASSVGLADRFAYSMTKGAVLTMTYSIAKDYIDYGIRCNCISPARVHTPFVDGFIKKNYPDNIKDMFDKLSKSQPIGRMARPQEIADLALFLCSE